MVEGGVDHPLCHTGLMYQIDRLLLDAVIGKDIGLQFYIQAHLRLVLQIFQHIPERRDLSMKMCRAGPVIIEFLQLFQRIVPDISLSV